MYILLKKNLFKIFLIIIFFIPSFSYAATLSISPVTGNFNVGDQVTLKVIVSSNDSPFNAVSGVVFFPTSIFSVESISKANSVLNFWVTEPLISKSAGTIKFEGISLGGFSGSTGSVITVNLRAIKAGEGEVSFKSGQVLANDGQGTDITGNLNSGNFIVIESTTKKIETETKTKPASTVIPKIIEEIKPSVIETTQPHPTLKSPEIMLGSRYGAQSIIGTSAYPETQFLMTFISEEGVKIFILGDSDQDGGFNVLVPKSLRRGFYTVKAVMIKADKTNSEESNLINIKIGNILSDVGLEIKIVMVLLVLAIIFLILRIYMHVDKKFNKSKKDELLKAENLIHKSFDILRDDVEDYNKNKLSASGHKQISSIKEDINDAEKIISKEIKDI
jgi:hypothetical protein